MTGTIEDLNVKGMATKKRHLGRSLADASFGEFRRPFTYTSPDRAATLAVVGRFYPSTKTCSSRLTDGRSAVKAKLHLWERVSEGSTCGMSLDRDVTASRTIEAGGRRQLAAKLEAVQPMPSLQDVAGLRPETRNADPRTETTGVPTGTAAIRQCGTAALRHWPCAPVGTKRQNHAVVAHLRGRLRRTWTGCSRSAARRVVRPRSEDRCGCVLYARPSRLAVEPSCGST